MLHNVAIGLQTRLDNRLKPRLEHPSRSCLSPATTNDVADTALVQNTQPYASSDSAQATHNTSITLPCKLLMA